MQAYAPTYSSQDFRALQVLVQRALVRLLLLNESGGSSVVQTTKVEPKSAPPLGVRLTGADEPLSRDFDLYGYAIRRLKLAGWVVAKDDGELIGTDANFHETVDAYADIDRQLRQRLRRPGLVSEERDWEPHPKRVSHEGDDRRYRAWLRDQGYCDTKDRSTKKLDGGAGPYEPIRLRSDEFPGAHDHTPGDRWLQQHDRAVA